MYVKLLLMYIVLIGNINAGIVVNSYPKLLGKSKIEAGRFQISYKHVFNTKASVKEPYLLLNERCWKQHKKYPGIKGYNGDITLKLEALGNIEKIKISAKITNNVDNRERLACINYSINGMNYIPVCETKFTAGDGHLSGELKLPFNNGQIYIKIARILKPNDKVGKSSFVCFKEFKIELYGKLPPKSDIKIVLPEQPKITDRSAAFELHRYIYKITGCYPKIVSEKALAKGRIIYLGESRFAKENGIDFANLKPEQWIIKSIGDKLILTGKGNRGTLLAVSHFLEDELGVRWWNPYEEYVPRQKTISLQKLNRVGVPAFNSREIYSLYGKDGGRYVALCRLIGDNGKLKYWWGSENLFGPPYPSHSMGWYIPSDKYFKDHPEWFAMVDGKRSKGVNSATGKPQLCLTNMELRQEMVKRLRHFIELGEQKAKACGIEAPKLYDISQNDNQKYCTCSKCQAFYKKEGAHSGLLLDFVNYIAREIKKDYPEIKISTLIYQYTEKPPKTIRPDDNVCIVLCDTLSNAAAGLNLRENSYFYKLLEKWSKLAENIRIWDYAVTYQKPLGMPYPNEFYFKNDISLFKRMGVKMLFTELEYPALGDARDYKVFLRTHLLENPDLDFNKLSQDFSDKFYGKAGKLFREYRLLLYQSQQKRHSHIGMFPHVTAFTLLDLETLKKANKIFVKGEELLKGDSTKLARWKIARLGVDRAILNRNKALNLEYFKKHGNLKGYPFDVCAIAKRIEKVWHDNIINRKLSKNIPVFLKDMKEELKKTTRPINIKNLKLPKRFAHISRNRIYDFTADVASLYKLELKKDSTAESGITTYINFAKDGKYKHPLKKYKLPLAWGVYSPSTRTQIKTGSLQANRIKNSNYNWYKLGTTKLTADSLIYIYWSWYLSYNVGEAFDPNHENQLFDVWAKIKFHGPAFPYGSKDEVNAISFERLVLIKK